MKRAAGSRRLPEGKALTVRQPWAWAIAAGHKDVENRSWPTGYRGTLLIHAARRFGPAEREHVRLIDRQYGIEVPEDELVLGAIIAQVQLVDVVRDSPSEWAVPGLFHFLLERPRRLRPVVECSGRLGLWHPGQRHGQLRMTGMNDADRWAAFVAGLTPLS